MSSLVNSAGWLGVSHTPPCRLAPSAVRHVATLRRRPCPFGAGALPASVHSDGLDAESSESRDAVGFRAQADFADAPPRVARGSYLVTVEEDRDRVLPRDEFDPVPLLATDRRVEAVQDEAVAVVESGEEDVVLRS